MSSPPNNLRRILCIQLADIGDLVVTTPALNALRETFADAQIDILTTPHAAPILNHTGLVNTIYTAPRNLIRLKHLRSDVPNLLRLLGKLMTARYDAVLLFHHLTTWIGVAKYILLTFISGARIRAGLDNGRGGFLTHKTADLGWGGKHQADYYLSVAELIGATTTDKRLKVSISDEDRQWARAQLNAHDANVVIIHPGSGGFSLARRWEPEKFAAVADSLAIDNARQIILVGGKDDDAESMLQHMQHQPLNLVAKTTLNQLAAVLERAEEYYSTDSGVMHIATAALPHDKLLNVLYGPSNHLAWGPYRDQPANIYRSGVRCSPCSYVGHTLGLRNGCEARTCMKILTAQQVLSRETTIPNEAQPLPPTLRVLGVPIHAMTFAGFLDQLGAWIKQESPSPRQLCTVNPEYIMLAQQDVLMYNILKRADLCVADGVGVLWAAKRLGHPLPERVTGSDGTLKIAERAARDGWRLFLLGAADGIAAKTAEILQNRFPGLQIAGTFAGDPSGASEDAIAAYVAASHADVLLVAFGQGKQDHWIARNLPRLNVKVALGVGGAFDFIAGVAERAPVWMQHLGLEWLHRLIKQPWRWRRMLRLPLFVLLVLWRGERGPWAFEGGKP